jgi:penicillin-binding protein 2
MPFFDAQDQSRYTTFSRRTAILGGGMAAVFGIIAGRLYQLQILNGDVYLTRAEENRISERLLAPPRGRILDRFGVSLASNRRNYRALMVPEQTAAGFEETLDALAKVITVPDEARRRILREGRRSKTFVPVVVAENLAWEDFARLNLYLPYLPGVQPDVCETRDYPYAEELSHVLGYVAQVSPEDKKSADNPEDPLLDLPGFRIGKKGIEKALDGEIRGKAGAHRVEVNVYGRTIRELNRVDGDNGDDVYLTIDQELQHAIYERMKGQSGGCTVMDTETGDVLALVSTPGFDPNAFNVGLSNEQWKSLTTDEYKPLTNKVVSGMYPPGSTFKMVTALAALESGLMDENTKFLCTGGTRLGNHVFHCWKRGGHGTLDLHLGLKDSCDCYFYEVARKIGIDAILDMARRLGFGTATGIDIPGERSGFVPSREWKRKTFKEDWQLGETLIAGIGQGFLQVTPLQLCTYAARLASGKMVSPRLVHARGKLPDVAPLPVVAEHLAAVRGGMNAVMNEGGGTAWGSRIKQAGFEMAGKTGTAQVRRISTAERAGGVRSNDSLPWRLRDHALFVAFAPVAAPRYACSVVIEHGSSGSGFAAPIARDALLLAQQRGILDRNTAFPIATADAKGRTL